MGDGSSPSMTTSLTQKLTRTDSSYNLKRLDMTENMTWLQFCHRHCMEEAKLSTAAWKISQQLWARPSWSMPWPPASIFLLLKFVHLFFEIMLHIRAALMGAQATTKVCAFKRFFLFPITRTRRTKQLRLHAQQLWSKPVSGWHSTGTCAEVSSFKYEPNLGEPALNQLAAL